MAIKGLNLSTETSLKNTTAMIKFQILVQIIHGLKKKMYTDFQELTKMADKWHLIPPPPICVPSVQLQMK